MKTTDADRRLPRTLKMLLKIFTTSILFLAGFLTLACPAPCDIKDDEMQAIYADLSQVEQAIEDFRKDQKIYPKNLNELAPKYLLKIPPTAGGRKFQYIRTSDDKYNLRVNNRNGGSYSGSCSYSEIEDRWKDLSDK